MKHLLLFNVFGVFKLEMVREVIVGSVEREERLKALIYSAIYLKVPLFFI